MLEDVRDWALWNERWLNNALSDYVSALAIFAVTYAAFYLVRYVMVRRIRKWAEKTDNDLDDLIAETTEIFGSFFYFYVAFYLSSRSLVLNDNVENWIGWGLWGVMVFYFTRGANVLIDYFFKQFLRRRYDKDTVDSLDFLERFTSLTLWFIAFLFVLSNIGVNIASLVAGLGIGGIAVALALQNILSDLFSSFAIFFDRPFKKGDFIIVGEHMGVVKQVGIKTTRLQALQGEEIVMSNQELAAARVQNFKRMRERRIVFHFGVTYDTPTAKMREIPDLVQKIIEGQEKVQFDRVHFQSFDDWALTYEVVYYVKTSDYNYYMDVNQEIMLAIKEQFEKKNIEMAFPTRTVHINQLEAKN